MLIKNQFQIYGNGMAKLKVHTANNFYLNVCFNEFMNLFYQNVLSDRDYKL